MLKLKSIVKTEQQLLATGWERVPHGYFTKKDVGSGWIYVKPEMIGCTYNAVIKEQTDGCELEGSHGVWTLHPEMVLHIDQWGFVRDPETLEILMWDAVCGNGVVKDIDNGDKFPIYITGTDRGSDCYTKEGKFISKSTPQLSKYPCSLIHGGYTPFSLDELVEAFNCPKVLEGENDETSLAEEALDPCLHQPVGPHDIKPPVTLDNPINDSYMTSEVIKKLADSMKYCDNDLKTKISDKIIELLGRI